jgi:hypothetical protein
MDISSSCAGPTSCAPCPRHTSSTIYTPVWENNYCLFVADRNQIQAETGDLHTCDRMSFFPTGQGCTADQGCQRREDCNKCSDRLCKECHNFDKDECNATTSDASKCIANASYVNGACKCNSTYYFDEYTDTCTRCHSYC